MINIFKEQIFQDEDPEGREIGFRRGKDEPSIVARVIVTKSGSLRIIPDGTSTLTVLANPEANMDLEEDKAA